MEELEFKEDLIKIKEWWGLSFPYPPPTLVMINMLWREYCSDRWSAQFMSTTKQTFGSFLDWLMNEGYYQ